MKPSASGSLPGTARQAALNAHGESCTYCSWEVADAVDHVIPVSEGGRDDVSNIVPACRRCNSSKRDRTVLRWKQDIHARPSQLPPWTSPLFGGPSYHDPDRVVDLPADAVVKHVEQVQDEVAENFEAHELQVALRLLNDLNRFVSQMGNLSAERRSLLRKEALLRLLDYEEVLLAKPHDRKRALWEADLRQVVLKRALSEAVSRSGLA
ncbi:HNH endonuclease [Streptomyces venezuelae]|uniref:HNH endonuclease n=1 Tax=Streptomyces venezuelae TaxID=54571 RepID=UPI0037AFE139